jgi:glycerol-3-phosphate acyltransferase PlsY
VEVSDPVLVFACDLVFVFFFVVWFGLIVFFSILSFSSVFFLILSAVISIAIGETDFLLTGSLIRLPLIVVIFGVVQQAHEEAEREVSSDIRIVSLASI